MEDAIYRQSTQYRFFTFTPSSLSSLRAATNAHAAKQLLAELGSSASPELMLTPIEELKLVTYYLTTLFVLCDHFKGGSGVKATAMTFLSRLYLRISPLQIHPKTLLLPILFLALKSEGGIQSTTWFIKTAAEMGLTTTKEELLAPEINIAMNLRWSFHVLHPYRGLDGVRADLLVRGEQSKERILTCYNKARALLTTGVLFTDCYFLYTPGQITMAGIWAVDPELCEGYLRSKVPAGEEKVLEKLLGVVRECAQRHLLAKKEDGNDYPGLLLRLPQNGVFMSADVPAELKKEAVRIDRKLQLLKKPLNGKVKHQAVDAAEEERKAKKRKLEQEKMDLDDVFGGGSIIQKK